MAGWIESNAVVLRGVSFVGVFATMAVAEALLEARPVASLGVAGGFTTSA